MPGLEECKWCEKKNDPAVAKCANCGSPNWKSSADEAEKWKRIAAEASNKRIENFDELDDRNLLIELLKAERKTTHAVRSLAITFVAMPLILAVVGLGLAMSTLTGNLAAIALMGLTGAIVIIWVLVRSIQELRAST